MQGQEIILAGKPLPSAFAERFASPWSAPKGLVNKVIHSQGDHETNDGY